MFREYVNHQALEGLKEKDLGNKTSPTLKQVPERKALYAWFYDHETSILGSINFYLGGGERNVAP